MKRMLVCMLLVSLFAVAAPAIAQEDEEGICTPDYIGEQVDAAIATFQEALAEAEDTDGGLQAVEAFQDALTRLQDYCASLVAGGVTLEISPGSGTLDDPYTFGVAGDSGEGFTIKVTGYIRPADRIIHRANMFNDRPEAGEVYIIVGVEVVCLESTLERCETTYLDYELVGSSGTIYDVPFVVYDDELDVSLFAGGSGEGDLVFLIREDETNLRLMYHPYMFRDEVIVYEAAPSLEHGIQVVSANNINVRRGPGTNFSIAGTLIASRPDIAFGRNEDGTWLQIPTGWVFAELVTADGDIEILPVTWQQ